MPLCSVAARGLWKATVESRVSHSLVEISNGGPELLEKVPFSAS